MTVLWLNNTTKTTNIMNTIFLLCQCDSLVTTVCGNSIPVVITKTYEAGTNGQDVEIAKAICHAVVAIAALLVVGFLVWKIIEYIATRCAERIMMKKEKEEAQRKQQADLLEKKLQILHDLCYSSKEKVKDTNIEKILKSADCKEVLNYLKAIDPTYKPQYSAS